MDKISIRKFLGLILIVAGLSFWFSPFFAGLIFIAVGLTLIFGKEFWLETWEKIKGFSKKENPGQKNHKS